MKVFVPISDDMMDDPAFREKLVPYQAGYQLLNQIKGDALVTDSKSERPVPSQSKKPVDIPGDRPEDRLETMET
jgi:hypothetical protein